MSAFSGEFFSKDERLRVVGHPTFRKPAQGPSELPVDQQNFPQLYRAFQTLQESAGISGYKLVILGDDFGGAGIDYKRQTVGIGIRMLNSMSFDEILSVISHEMGHECLKDHPGTPQVGAAIAGLGPEQMQEIYADRLGACFMGETQSAISALGSGVAIDDKLPNSLRIAALENFNMAQCDVVAPRPYNQHIRKARTPH